MKTFYQIITEAKKNRDKKFTLDQINVALLKAGIGPGIIAKAMNALNLARGLGLVEDMEDTEV